MRTTCIIFSSKDFKSKISRGRLPEHKFSLKNTHTEQSGEQKTVNKGRLRETQEQRNKVQIENSQRAGEATTGDLTQKPLSSNTLGIFFFQAGLFSFCSLKKIYLVLKPLFSLENAVNSCQRQVK